MAFAPASQLLYTYPGVNVKGAFNQEEALEGAFSVIAKSLKSFEALPPGACTLYYYPQSTCPRLHCVLGGSYL